MVVVSVVAEVLPEAVPVEELPASKAKFVIDPELFKKLDDTDIWEFRTFYKKVKYRLLAFWDKDNGADTLVIATHGFIKKTQKTPPQETAKAEEIRKAYFNSKK